MTIGTSQIHDSAELHVTGRALYTDDISLPSDALHLTFGLASIAHGSIKTLDLGQVKASRGVVAVLTSSDLKYANDTSPSTHDEPLLSDGKIHYFGQPIFIVIAESHLLSRKAAKKAKISYATYKPILTIEDALNAKSYFEKGPRQYSKGNAQAAVERAQFQLEDSFVVGGQEHFYLEGQVAFAIPQDDTGMVVLSSSQHPTEVQHKVAEALGVEMNQVRVEIRRMGGAFGGKESQGNALAVACAVAAQITKKPCKMRYDRDDDMIITGKRHDFNISYNVGFNKLGRILGITFQHFVRCGWSQDLSLPVADRAMLHADNAYNLTNVDITSHRLRTNTQSNTAFRGFGGPQGIIGIERALDHIAHFLNLDPLDIRKQNFYKSYP
ncbi:MAG: molybdopterin-dependent oxidoreductase, partial [Proteobacteria bacterium]|nr:molybdopterin-dependent oxidoreductase [Pseudomonadota bacterium]